MSSRSALSAVRFGLESLLSDTTIRGKVGLVTNDTARDAHGIHLVERLADHPRLKLVRILTPEHGFGSDAPDGEAVADGLHQRFQIPIVSLFGPKKVPGPEDLAGLDLLVYDIQDVGVRFYTYISTLRNLLDAAATAQIPVHVLDRPDLLGGTIVEGPMLTPGFESFVGHLPIPLRYGLTPGELALLWNRRRERRAPLTVWPCSGWQRGMSFLEWQTPWVKLSPSMASPATAAFYPGTCLFEGTNISEGRGTDAPFQILGAPWVAAEAWAERLAPLLPPGIELSVVSFTPTFSKYEGEACRGIRMGSRSPLVLSAVRIGIAALSSLLATHGGRIEFPGRPTLPHPFFDHLAGCAWLREGLIAGAGIDELYARAQAEVAPFRVERDAALLY